MRHLLILTMTLATLALGCAQNAQLEATDAPGEATRAPSSDVKAFAPSDRGRAGEGVCRAYGLPDGFDAKGLTIRGAFAGELHGAAIGDELDYLPALEACIADAECLGITSSWYIGAPFKLIKVGGEAQPDDDSYACSVVISGRP